MQGMTGFLIVPMSYTVSLISIPSIHSHAILTEIDGFFLPTNSSAKELKVVN